MKSILKYLAITTSLAALATQAMGDSVVNYITPFGSPLYTKTGKINIPLHHYLRYTGPYPPPEVITCRIKVPGTTTYSYYSFTKLAENFSIDRDNAPPQITSPSDVTVNADPGRSEASNVDLGTPVTSDNCGTPTVVGERSDGKSLKDPYPLGVTTITWTASDIWLNNSFATQTVTVNPTDQPLAASDATYARGPGMSLKIRIADIAWDLNGLPVTVQSLGASAQGATLSSNGTYIFYLPANNNNDSFTYTVTNTVNGTATGTITVNVAASGGIAKKLTVSGGSATIKFFGIPGLQYDVQRTTSLVEPVTWTTLTTTPLEPGADGSFTFTDTSAPAGSAYYRSVQH